MRFSRRGRGGYSYRDKRFHKPYAKPGTRRGLYGSDLACNYRGDAHRHATPSRHGGKFRRRFHGFAYVAKMVGRSRVDGDGTGSGSRDGAGLQHCYLNLVNSDRLNVARKLADVLRAVKYFMEQSTITRRQRFGRPAHTV